MVNKGQTEDLPSIEKKESSDVTGGDEGDRDERNLNAIEGFLEGYNMAEANLDALIKRHYKRPETAGEHHEAGQPQASSGTEVRLSGHARPEAALTVPVTVCPVYMRIQPVLAVLPFSLPYSNSTTSTSDTATSLENTSNHSQPAQPVEDTYLFFIVLLRDPTNQLLHKTLTQSMPSAWLSIPFEENEWVEDIMVEIIRRGVEILGEEYVKGRMTGRLLKNAQHNDKSSETRDDGDILFEDKEVSEDEDIREGMQVANASVGVLA